MTNLTQVNLFIVKFINLTFLFIIHLAAHCIQWKNSYRTLLPRELLLIIGGHDINLPYESGRETRSPTKIHIHPDWNPQAVNYDADIAILELEHSINFNNFIQPICLWESPDDPKVSTGIIVGYGMNENRQLQNIPKLIEIPIKNQEECFLKEPLLASLSSKRTFCAGTDDERGVCVGDSGGGMFVKINNIFYLRGIVSSSLTKHDRSCNSKKYSVFTNVLKFKKWIKNLDSNEDEEDIECGITSASSGLIQGGQFSSKREFPWMAVIFDNVDDSYASGALVSKKHVVVRGNNVAYKSFNDKFISITARRLKIYFGVLNYENLSDSTSMNAVKVSVHPEMRRTEHIYIKNIGIITLENAIAFSEFIRPVCLWQISDHLNLIKDLPIYGVGYGRDYTGKDSKVRKYVQVKLTEKSRCDNEFEDFDKIKGICIKSDNGAPCWNDDTLFVKYNGKWYLRGLFSRAFVWEQWFLTEIINFGDKTCNTFKPFGYEDVAQLTQWIQDEINV